MKELVIALVVVFVLLMWLIAYYGTRRRTYVLSEADKQRMLALQELASKLEHRVEVLESILDIKYPDWRGQG